MSGGRVRVLPGDESVEVAAGENLMAAAGRAGLSWPTLCRGKAKCAVCALQIVDGGDLVSPALDNERQALRTYRGVDHDRDPSIRLACQLQVQGPVVVRKPGVRRATDGSSKA